MVSLILDEEQRHLNDNKFLEGILSIRSILYEITFMMDGKIGENNNLYL